MVLSDTAIRRPVLATVMNLVLILVGLIAYDRLSVRLIPNVDTPVVTVATNYPGANAKVIESQITKPIEDVLSGVEGVDFLTSVNRAEQSQITVTFRLDRDADAAASDVRDRVAQARQFLPDEADEPIVQKQEGDAQPIIYLAFSSSEHSLVEIADLATRLVKDRVQTIPGVAQASVFGSRYAMRVWLQPERLASMQLTPADVETALRQQNVEIPAGRVEGIDREFTVLAQTDLATPEQFGAVILRNDGGNLLRLRDVARVELGQDQSRFAARFNGENAVALGIVKQAVANPLEISDALARMLPQIKRTLPEGVEVDIAYDSTVFIRASISEVYITIAEAVLLVVLVIFFFLRSGRATLIPLVTIPVSLIGAFTVMYVLGFSINTLTLLAMVLAIGLVVDDAIVMLENIYRYIEQGMTPREAAFKGSREIAFAIIAMTLTLAAVYAPMAFQTGRTGKLFTEFALTLAGAVLVSGFTALTLSPMMCSRLLKHETSHGVWYQRVEALLRALDVGYRRQLTRALNWRKTMMSAAAVMSVAMVGVFLLLPQELAPNEDQGLMIGFAIAPEGSTLAYTDSYVQRMADHYKDLPEVAMYFQITGFPVVTQGINFARFVDWSERDRSAGEIVASLFPQFMGIAGVLAFPVMPPPLGQQDFGQPVQFVIQTTGTWEDLDGIVQRMLAKMRDNPQLTNPDSDLKLNKPELRVGVDRDKVGAVGSNVEAVGRTLETLLGGRNVTRFKRGAEQYDVIVQVEDAARRTPGDLGNVYVRGGDGSMVQLGNLATVTETVAAKELNHFNKLRATTISAGLAPGYAMGDALDWMENSLREIAPDALYDLSGQSREFRESSSSFGVLLLLAMVFIYLVLAAQFESFVDPFVILFSVLPAFFGAFVSLKLSSGSWNIYSQIGVITLIGLIAKHGILIVEFANQLRERGEAKLEAVIDAAALRLRPILMTTGAMVLGALPLALASGAGAEARHQIGWVIVGGMSVGTFFTLFLVPVGYVLLARARSEALD